jgi:DNA-binding GntR family transcriptional regulator
MSRDRSEPVTPDAPARAQVEVEEEYRQLVARMVDELRRGVSEEGVPVSALVEKVHQETGISRSTIREALSKLVYGGDVVLTEDRQLVTR